MSIDRYELGWFALAALVVAYELWTNAHGKATLTDTTLKFMPWWIIMPFLSWLNIHFATGYFVESKSFKKLSQN